jgi:hypothetical protein
MARRKRRLLPLVAPLLLVGCGPVPGGSAPGAGSTAGAGGVTAGNEWLVVAPGSATPSPRPSIRVSPSPSAVAVAPIASRVPPAPVARVMPTYDCIPDTPDFARVLDLTVVPGTTSAKISWFNTGGYNLVEYRITAQSQDLVFGRQRDVGWVKVKPVGPCGPVSVTLPNLDRKTTYIFSVDAVVVRRSGDGTHAATIFRSHPVATK